ncbi:hypothetical protein [Microbispora sp. H13382]|uniref:hypothetical protein n=1 Tax=Microbispora sp. H13382 TaxID=2729112 RepID=UPI001601019D|nr:hypothetical protein [Microbispora sp. H13382]
MPLCTAAVLAAALLSGPAAVPPDPAPPGTRATTDKNNATTPSTGRPQLASLPGMAPQAGEFPFPIPQAPPWMAPSGTDGRRNDTGAAPESPAAPSSTGASGTDAGSPAQTSGDRAAGGENTTKFVPVIDPTTRDVFIQPVLAPGEAPKPFTFRPVQGVQNTKSYPMPRGQQKTAQQKAPRHKTVTRPGRHQSPRLVTPPRTA